MSGWHENERSYRTGDIGRLDAMGSLTRNGRANRQVKWNGNRIELDEIERAADRIPEVLKAACSAIEEADRIVDIVQLVQRRSNSNLARSEILEQLAVLLPPLLLPVARCR